MTANPNTPCGFRAIRNVAGTAPLIKHYDGSATVNVFVGAPVGFNSTYQITNWTTTIGLGGIVGVAVHARKTTDTNRDVAVYVGRDQEYEVQLDTGATVPVTLATLLDTPNYVILTPAAGNATTLQSTAQIDASSGNTTVGTLLQVFRVYGFSPIVGQDDTGTNARVVGKFVDEALFFEKTV
jgi:hypothetical protein